MSATPPFLVGASLLFWGLQTGNWIAAVPLAIALEAPRYAKLRFDLGAAEHSRIADLCTVAFVATAALLAANRGVAHGVLAAFQWLPVALAPILAAQQFSATGRIPLSALFRYLRKLKRENPAVKDPLVDTGPVYVALVLIAAGVTSARSPAYYAGVVAAVAWGLYAIRPRHASLAAWALMVAGGAALGHAGHLGLGQMQAQLEAWIAEWHLKGLEGDAFRSTTDIGSLGKLKLLDTIVLRVYAPPGEARRVRLLHRASYNTYIGTTWLARGAPMDALAPDAGGANWTLAEARPDWRVRFAARPEHGRMLLALPASAARLTDFPAVKVQRNALGAVHAEVAGDWIQYGVETARAAELAQAPGREDNLVPHRERATFEALAAELGLRGLPVAEALRRVERHFEAYSYSTWREKPVPAGQTPLGDFVANTRSGHCEYFAAATTLLLRAAGVPARYATGFAVMEHSTLENAFVVRARHAHAWTRVWDGGRWVDLDTTPASWFEEEAQLAPFWSGLADLARWAGFRWSQRGEFEASDAWYAVLALLAAALAWRLLRGRRVAPGSQAPAAPARAWPGADSEFYAAAKALPPRDAGESLEAWHRRIEPAIARQLRPLLHELLALHQRYRFDPQGLDAGERERLRSLALTCVKMQIRSGA